jgi:branched-chain amino acid transport system substrate-binding protein
MQRRKWLGLVAGLAVFSLIAAACSNDGDASGTDGGTTEVDCATVEFGCVEIASGEPITLGTLLAISGDVAFLGTDSVHGVELAVDNLDGTLDGTPGQVLGHDIDIVQEDDLCSTEGGQAGATNLVANDAVVAVIGTSCSSAALGVADKITSDAGVLMVSPSNTNPALTSAEAHQAFYARTAHNDKIQGAIVAEFAFNDLGATTGAIIVDESPYAQGLGQAFDDNFSNLGGTITGTEQIKSDQTDFKPVLNSLAQGDPEVLYFPDFNPACALIAKQAAEIMPDAALIGSDGCLETSFLEQAGDSADGVYASSPDVTVFQGGDFYSNEFLQAYEAQFGTEPTSVFHAHAYDAATILFGVIEDVAIDNGDGSISIPRGALKDAFFATEGYEGITGTITCGAEGDCATDVTIGIFQAPGWPVEGGSGSDEPVYSDTKTLADVI